MKISKNQLKQSHSSWEQEITDCVLYVMLKRSSVTSVTYIFRMLGRMRRLIEFT